jgi:hypothetical protein
MASRAKPEPVDPSQLERLVALRDLIAARLIVEIDGSKVAQLSREYRQLIDRVEELAPTRTASKVDELANRRAGRNTITGNPSTSKRRSKSG